MPKTNDNGGATAAGMTGIVEHGAPINDGRKFSELDPELNLDGTLVEGDHPDHPAGEERETVSVSDARPQDRDFGDEVDEDQAKRGDKDTGVSAKSDEDTQNLEPVYSTSTDEKATPNTIKPASARGKK